ncbi:phospholipase A2 [Pseudarthrobacter oxydans]|uniref:phospholipase A2 n=1 Tax=Pseudarthrobacter oxydans TaxID=1671 RepID=UPI003F4FF5D1
MEGTKQKGIWRRLASSALAVLTALVLVGSVSLTAAPQASAASSTTITSQYWWAHNGCTMVTDTPLGVSFTHACNHHDGCYALRWSRDRATCDWWFYNDMRNACNAAAWWLRPDCYLVASAYYGAVRAAGWYYWNSNSQLVRINTSMA